MVMYYNQYGRMLTPVSIFQQHFNLFTVVLPEHVILNWLIIASFKENGD